MSKHTPPEYSNSGHDDDESPHAASDLTAFQQNILAVLADESMYGLAIKEALEAYYGEDINHGRLYPNLDELADRGLVTKNIRDIDNRTNTYELTADGRDTLAKQVAWLGRTQKIDVVSDE